MFLAHPGRPARTSPFHPELADLPARVPLFPLAEAALLPNCDLPLNVFEPRFLAMARVALGSRQRMIGLIQPSEKAEREDAEDAVENPEVLELSDLRPVGCAGRIVSFAETADGRNIVVLRGVCRFRPAAEPEMDPAGFAWARMNWTPYAADLLPPPEDDLPEQAPLRDLTLEYLRSRGMKAGDSSFGDDMTVEDFVNNMTMLCPFSAAEKQALVEADTVPQRAELLRTIMTMSLRGGAADGEPTH